VIFKKFLFLCSAVACNSLVAPSAGDWNPIIYNSIKWTDADQGNSTIEYTTMQGITRVPVAYHGGVDTNASGKITNENINSFTDWVHITLTKNYCGPVVLDYEDPWWRELQAKTVLPERLQEILDVYLQGIQVAKEVQPSAQWGYWGLPLMRNTSVPWTDQGLSLEPLVNSCTALYPDIYNCTPEKDTTGQVEKHISSVLKLAAGRMPVYVFASMRYCGPEVGHSDFVPDMVFLKQVNAALHASWVDASGVQHRIKGIILWDNYGFSQQNEWAALDQKHKYFFELLSALSTAWSKKMKGTDVIVGPTTSSECQYGLAEPTNSSETIHEIKHRGQSEEVQEAVEENTRIPSERLKGNRVVK